MSKRALLFIGLVALSMVLVACSAGKETTQPAELSPDAGSAAPNSAGALVKALESAGLEVVPAGSISQPFFTPEARIVTVEGQDLQLFEYESPEAAEAEAALVSPTGSSVGTSMISWMAAPHFYRSGRLIAITIGDNVAVLEQLEAALGPQFAGG